MCVCVCVCVCVVCVCARAWVRACERQRCLVTHTSKHSPCVLFFTSCTHARTQSRTHARTHTYTHTHFADDKRVRESCEG